MNNNPIGGFFELEINIGNEDFHSEAIALTNGRACISWILQVCKPTKIYIPFYTCYAVYEPMEKLGITYEFYKIDEDFNPVDLPLIRDNELLVYINFFGLKNGQLPSLIKKYGNKLIVDNTHNFFNKGYKNCMSFTSARKYFGVPDGAYLYTINETLQNISIPRYTDIKVDHNIKRIIGKQEEAYKDYVEYEKTLGYEIKKISIFSEKLLSSIDYEEVSKKRKLNFNYLHEKLKSRNKIKINDSLMDTPFCYPFLPKKKIDKKEFYKENIFVPTLWPDILDRQIKGYEFEKKLTRDLLPLPIDQRYNEKDMDRIYNLIVKRI